MTDQHEEGPGRDDLTLTTWPRQPGHEVPFPDSPPGCGWGCSYLPPLAPSPGHLAADTQGVLTLDPGRLLGDAVLVDARQFGGWVPHQVIGYLWPSGPWFWLGSTLGAPMWVVHRLWLGTILFAAALERAGVRGSSASADSLAVVAATAYLLTPFTLPTCRAVRSWCCRGPVSGG
ncbi:MAG: alpha-(1-_3)-arabinofuranosyltransferase family protein [Ilumatobacteraceae bacterium]